MMLGAVPQLRLLVAGLSPWCNLFSLRQYPVGCVADKVEVMQVFSGYFSLFCQFLSHQILQLSFIIQV